MSLILKKCGSLNIFLVGCRDEFNTKEGISPVIMAFFCLLV
jgi:hypothetical protein